MPAARHRPHKVAAVWFEVEAVLFDIDGTLVDSTAVVERTWRTLAESLDIDASEILRVCHGRRTEDTVAMFLPADQQAAAVVELERLERADLADVVALPGTKTLLSSLPFDRWAGVTSGSRADACSARRCRIACPCGAGGCRRCGARQA